MTQEQRVFLQLLRSYVLHCPMEKSPAGTDWEQIARIAREQSLGGIAFAAGKRLLPEHDKAYRKLQECFLSDAYHFVQGEDDIRMAMTSLQEHRISFLLFKGEVLRQYYPDPELRTMGDHDFLVHAQDQEEADEALRHLGYRRFIDNHAVWTYVKGNTILEFHNTMFYEELSNQTDYRGYFEKVWETAEPGSRAGEYRPEPNLHFVYLICHMAKHIINKGVGFRPFLDLSFFIRKEKRLNWSWLSLELSKLELLDFTRACLGFCREWFGVSVPLCLCQNEPDLEFLEEATEKIFLDGTFGLDNKENETGHEAKEIRRSGKLYQRTACRLAVQRLFPSYEDMQLVPWYSFVDGKPWLLPWAWMYRWGYAAKYKLWDSLSLLLRPWTRRKEIEKRNQYLGRWGL